MEEEKIPKQKPHTSFNSRLSVAKNWEEHDNGQIEMLIFYFTGGTWQRGNMAKSILVYM